MARFTAETRPDAVLLLRTALGRIEGRSGVEPLRVSGPAAVTLVTGLCEFLGPCYRMSTAQVLREVLVGLEEGPDVRR